MINQEKTQAQHLQFLGDLYVVHQVQAFCPGGARGDMFVMTMVFFFNMK